MGIFRLEFWENGVKIASVRDATVVPQDGHLVELNADLRGRSTYRVLPRRTTHVFTEGGGYDDPDIYVEGAALKKLDVELVPDEELAEQPKRETKQRRR